MTETTFPNRRELDHYTRQHDATRFDERRDPLAEECPECGAKLGVRCTEQTGWSVIARERYGQPRRYRHVKPHAERVTVAWRKWLAIAER